MPICCSILRCSPQVLSPAHWNTHCAALCEFCGIFHLHFLGHSVNGLDDFWGPFHAWFPPLRYNASQHADVSLLCKKTPGPPSPCCESERFSGKKLGRQQDRAREIILYQCILVGFLRVAYSNQISLGYLSDKMLPLLKKFQSLHVFIP